jgi:predicted Zn-dependent peptidase
LIESLGADLNGGTTEDYTHYYTTVPSADFSTALNVIADAIVHPKFRAEDMEKERRVILDEIARRENDPSQRVLDLLDTLIFPSHPYGRSMAGTRETIGKLTRDDLVSYYSAHFRPTNTAVVIAGDVSKADVIPLVEKAFEGWSARFLIGTTGNSEAVRVSAHDSPGTPGIEETPTLESPQIKRVACKVSQAYVAVGFRAPGIADFKDTCALDVLLILFGDTARGRISTALAGVGIPFSRIKADYVTHREPSVFSVIAAVDPADADRAVPAIVGEFRKPAKYAVSEDELSYAKRLIVGGDLFEQETFAGQARSLGFYASIKSYDLSVKYIETVRSITSADITALAQKYFTTEGYTLAILEPEAAK